MGVLGWDQRVTMPPLGGAARAEALATLGRIAHEKFVDDEIGALLERLRPLEESLEYDSDDASLIRVTRRDWEKSRRVPAELRAEMLRAGSQGHHIWVEARAQQRLRAPSCPSLERNLELKRRYVECFEWDDSPYTPLLDDFEPFMKTTEVAEVFDDDQAGALRAREAGARGRRVVPRRRRTTADAAARVRRAHRSRRSASRRARGASTRPCTRSARRSRRATSA